MNRQPDSGQCTCPGETDATAGYDPECPIHGWEPGDGPILTPETA